MMNSSYFMESESLVEVSRLLRLDEMVTRILGLLPPQVDGHTVQRVLDIGCGTGGWLLNLARAFPHIVGWGCDLSPLMIQMAQSFQRAEQSQHITFCVADARKPLFFEEASFDYIHLRFAQSYLRASMWEQVLHECYRLLRPGGGLCISDLELSLSQKPHAELAFALAPLAYGQANDTFSSSHRSIGVLPALKDLIHRVGFVNQHISLFLGDFSAGSEYHETNVEIITLMYLSMKHFLLQHTNYSEDQLEELFQQARKEMALPDFVGMNMYFTNYSQKPAEERRIL